MDGDAWAPTSHHTKQISMQDLDRAGDWNPVRALVYHNGWLYAGLDNGVMWK
jgi:hypothetical protein